MLREPQEIEDREDELAVARVAAVDVAKASGVVCSRVPREGAACRFVTKVWPVDATTNAILELADQLAAAEVQKVVLESTSVIRGRQRASATAGDGPGLPVSPSVADGLSGELPPRGQPTTELIPLRPLVDAAFALPLTDAYVRALPAATPSLIFVTPDNGRLLAAVLLPAGGGGAECGAGERAG